MKLNTGFSQYTDSGLADKADTIVKALTGNAKFPTTVPTLATISTLIQNLRGAIAYSGNGHAEAVAGARAALSGELVSLAINLMATAGVTEADLATTGYDLPQAPVRTGAKPAVPQNLRLKHGMQSGIVIPQFEAVSTGGVRVYEAEWTLDPNAGPWQDGGTFPNSRAMSIQGLPRAKDIWVRVRALGTNGPSGWSDPATILVN